MRSFFQKIAMLTALGIMLLGMIPAAARADILPVSQPEELKSAISTAAETDEIQLTSDIINVYVSLSNRKNVTVNLNGHTLTAESGKPAFYLKENASLTLTGTGTIKGGGNYNCGILDVRSNSTLTLSGNITLEGNTSTTNTGAGAVFLYTNSRFQMENGVIQGTSAPNGGAVFIPFGCTMTMTGGTIQNTSSSNLGGAVYNAGTFNMEDGVISGTNAPNGGAAYIATTGSMTMTGGKLEKAYSSGHGGAVYNAHSFTMKGGSEITAAIPRAHRPMPVRYISGPTAPSTWRKRAPLPTAIPRVHRPMAARCIAMRVPLI